MKLINKSIWLFCLLLLVSAPGYAESSPFEKMGVVPSKTSKSAPDFVLQNVQGETVKLSDFKGKVLLLNFWATWCAACKEEMASMQNLYSALRADGVEVLAISIDRWNEDRIQEYVEESHLTFPVLLDQDQKVRKQYFVMGLPTSYLIDSEGKIRGYASGARTWDSPDAQK
ncbi:MAG: TlpA family protein disulfide reductase, partial [Nitrospina sp.]|nr:TlpA family protein disulfide reductase [Nitrospina sp.]